MNNGIMSNANIIPNGGACLLICTMNYRAILNVCIIPNSDRMHIAPNNGIKPNGTIVTHHYITHNN
jgi:hypothetical protein